MSANPLPAEIIARSPWFLLLQHGIRLFPTQLFGQRSAHVCISPHCLWKQPRHRWTGVQELLKLPDFQDFHCRVSSRSGVPPVSNSLKNCAACSKRVFIGTCGKAKAQVTIKEKAADPVLMEGGQFYCLLSSHSDIVFKTTAFWF